MRLESSNLCGSHVWYKLDHWNYTSTAVNCWLIIKTRIPLCETARGRCFAERNTTSLHSMCCHFLISLDISAAAVRAPLASLTLPQTEMSFAATMTPS